MLATVYTEVRTMELNDSDYGLARTWTATDGVD
jgi:hypothetical protein